MDDEPSEFAERYYMFLENSKNSKYDNKPNKPLLDLLSIQEREFLCAILKQTLDELVLINFKTFRLPVKDIPAKQGLDQIMGVKFEQDVDMLRKTFIETKQQMFENGNFDVLLDKIGRHIKDARDEYNLIWEFITNNTLCKELMKQSKLNKEEGYAKIKQLNEHIATLQSQIVDHKIQNQMKYGLVQKWEQTRHEQAKIILQEEETKLITIHQKCHSQIEREQIAIAEIETFIKYKIEMLLGMITYWEGKYKVDVTDLDQHIKETKDSIVDVQMKIDNIKEHHAERQVFIDEYREEQRILLEKRKFEEKQKNSAISIQSWWRGVMVRKQLGPYRPKKKNKKGGKGGKKK